jgi:hypothetical protein
MSIHSKKPYISHDKTKQLAQSLEDAQQKIRSLERFNQQEMQAHKATAERLEQCLYGGNNLLMVSVIFGFIIGLLASGLIQ